MVSHELRTPLTSMMAFADIIRNNKQGNLNEKDISRLDVIRRNGRRLSFLIGDLLDVSRIESGALKLEIIEVEVNQVIEELYESFIPILDEKKQTMKLELPTESINCVADKDRIGQVILNLMSNAQKYSQESKEIHVTMRADDESVYVSVAD
jgi:signal transduction histidine kinase